MTALTISQAANDLRDDERSNRKTSELSNVTSGSMSVAMDVEPAVSTCGHELDQLHFLWKALDDQARMGDAFTEFSEAIVPFLAGLAVERPSAIGQDFDLRNEHGRLKVIDTDMSPEDLAWFETRLNASPKLSGLAQIFNDAVVRAYGDGEDGSYIVWGDSRYECHDAVPGLVDSVDRDVKFMSLLRTVRDASWGTGRYSPYMEEHRYQLAASAVRDLVVSPETYRMTSAGDLVTASPLRSPMAKWKA